MTNSRFVMPVNPQVLQELIKKYGKKAVGAAVNAAKAKVMVPNMTGTATAAGTALRDIPKIESTVGKEAAVAAAALASPAIVADGEILGPALFNFGKDLASFEAIDNTPKLWGADRLSSTAADYAGRGVRAVLPDAIEEGPARAAEMITPFLVMAPEAIAGRAAEAGVRKAVSSIENKISSNAALREYMAARDFARANNFQLLRDPQSGERIFLDAANNRYYYRRNGQLLPIDGEQVAGSASPGGGRFYRNPNSWSVRSSDGTGYGLVDRTAYPNVTEEELLSLANSGAVEGWTQGEFVDQVARLDAQNYAHGFYDNSGRMNLNAVADAISNGDAVPEATTASTRVRRSRHNPERAAAQREELRQLLEDMDAEPVSVSSSGSSLPLPEEEASRILQETLPEADAPVLPRDLGAEVTPELQARDYSVPQQAALRARNRRSFTTASGESVPLSNDIDISSLTAESIEDLDNIIELSADRLNRGFSPGDPEYLDIEGIRSRLSALADSNREALREHYRNLMRSAPDSYLRYPLSYYDFQESPISSQALNYGRGYSQGAGRMSVNDIINEIGEEERATRLARLSNSSLPDLASIDTSDAMDELIRRIDASVGSDASGVSGRSLAELRELNDALATLSNNGSWYRFSSRYPSAVDLRCRVKDYFADALNDQYRSSAPSFATLDDAAKALQEARDAGAYTVYSTIEEYLIDSQNSPLRAALIADEPLPTMLVPTPRLGRYSFSSSPNYSTGEQAMESLLEDRAITADSPAVKKYLDSYNSLLDSSPTEQIFYQEFVPNYSERHAHDLSNSAVNRLIGRFGTKKRMSADEIDALKSRIQSEFKLTDSDMQTIEGMGLWDTPRTDYNALQSIVSGRTPLSSSDASELNSIIKEAYLGPSFHTPSGLRLLTADAAEAAIRRRIPSIPSNVPLSTVRNAFDPNYIDLAKTLREAGLAEMPADMSGFSWFQVANEMKNLSPGRFVNSSNLDKAVAHLKTLRSVADAQARTALQTRVLKMAMPRQVGAFEPHSSVDSYNVLAKNSLPGTGGVYGTGPGEVTTVQIPVNKYGFDTESLYTRGNNLQLNRLNLLERSKFMLDPGENGRMVVRPNGAGFEEYFVLPDDYSGILNGIGSAANPKEYLEHNPSARELLDNLINAARSVNKVDVDRTANMFKRINKENARIGVPLVDVPTYNTYVTSEDPAFYDSRTFRDMLRVARDVADDVDSGGGYASYMNRSPVMSLKHKYGGFLRDYSGGGSIHIKPSHRGKFTALLKRTGKTASWYKAHGTPAQKKMAVFALNSKHWSHKRADGGYLQDYGQSYELGGVYDLSEEQVQELIRQGYEVERI